MTAVRRAKMDAKAKMDSSAYAALRASAKRSRVTYQQQKAALREQLEQSQTEQQRANAAVDFLLEIIAVLVQLLYFVFPAMTVARMVYLMVRPLASPVGQDLGGIRGGVLIRLCNNCGWNQGLLEAWFLARNPLYTQGQVGPLLPMMTAGEWWIMAVGGTATRLNEELLPEVTRAFERGIRQVSRIGGITTGAAKRFLLGLWVQDEYNETMPEWEGLFFNGV